MQTLIDTPEDKRFGVTYARNQYNANVPPEQQITSDEAYQAWVMGQAVDSWCVQAMVAGYAPPVVEPPPGTINGVPQEVSARQAHEELAAQGLHDLLEPTDPVKSAVQACINQIADFVERGRIHNLFHKSTVFKRSMPELVGLWTGPAPYGLAKTLPELDQTFINAAAR